MMVDPAKRQNIPQELRGKLSAFDISLTEVENKFAPILKIPRTELNAKLSAIDKAKLELVAAYGINSLFWMYLNVCGVNPKEHGIKQELERIRSYMNRVKELQDKEKAPKVDVQASKRMVKSALWQAKKAEPITQESPADPKTSQTTVEKKGAKRKSEDNMEERAPKKKKKKNKKKKDKTPN